MTAGQSILTLLRELADEDGVVPGVKRDDLAVRVGCASGTLSFRLYELARIGVLERLDTRAPDGMTCRYRITGKAAARDKASAVFRKPAHRAPVDDAEIARRLKETHGIEVMTYRRGRYSEPVSLPRVRFVEGSPA